MDIYKLKDSVHGMYGEGAEVLFDGECVAHCECEREPSSKMWRAQGFVVFNMARVNKPDGTIAYVPIDPHRESRPIADLLSVINASEEFAPEPQELEGIRKHQLMGGDISSYISDLSRRTKASSENLLSRIFSIPEMKVTEFSEILPRLVSAKRSNDSSYQTLLQEWVNADSSRNAQKVDAYVEKFIEDHL